MNDSFEVLAEKLMEADTIYLFPHENPDGDAIGSTSALCSMLRSFGKSCTILIDEELPANLRFMDDDMFVIPEGEMESPDISMAVDCSELSRFPKLVDIFKSGRTSICLDHHLNDDPGFDYNHVDPKAAAAGELVYKLMKAAKHKPTKKEAECLFAAITTDTGDFLYSNTTKETHEIVCELYDSGIDVSLVGTSIYENESPEKLALIGAATENMKFYADGKIVATAITQEMLEREGAVMSDSEPVVARIRTVAGVEIALVFKEREENKISVSMRSKTYADVQKIAAKFGGGGHVRAAGCTIKDNLKNAMEMVIEAAEESLEK